MIIRCLDIETTGLDATKDAIVEIASVDLRSDGSIISTAETLVQPGSLCHRLPAPSTTSSTLT